MTISGTSNSRLNELRKYVVGDNFYNNYHTYVFPNIDGVDYNISNPNTEIVYIIGDIRYIDKISSGITIGTTFSFDGVGVNSSNFINVPIYKIPSKENVISNPKINNDVFIIRQELSAFDKNYKLEFVKTLAELETYAGGGFFNIINNT